MKALVTGGAGFMGSHVVDALLAKRCEVVALDDLSGGFADNVDPRARFVEGSILDNALVEKLFVQHRFDYVFHLAAYAAEGLSHFIRRFNYQNNLIGSVNLINASVKHEVKCFVFTSSIAVYGGIPPPMVESAQPQPEDPYGVAKFAVELDLRAAHEMFGLNYAVFRPHNVYGERQNIGDRYRNVLGIFMNQVMQGQPMTIFGDGKQTRAFSYIGDVAPAIVESAWRPDGYNEVYNVGADEWHDVNELAELVAEAFAVKPDIRHLPARLEVVHAYASHEKIARKLGFRAVTSLRDGVKRMATWARAKGPRKSKEFSAIEVDRNLPPSWKPST
ncbi:MAG TPA: NAD-dependent epimerase/dehydratase family protein [Kiritimatiellia bacterium]|jgi:UDP-glucose 4-epimerase